MSPKQNYKSLKPRSLPFILLSVALSPKHMPVPIFCTRYTLLWLLNVTVVRISTSIMSGYQLGMLSILNNGIATPGLNKRVYNSYITADKAKVAAGIILVAQRWQSWHPFTSLDLFFLATSVSKSEKKRSERLCLFCSFKKKNKSFPKGIFNKLALCLPDYTWIIWHLLLQGSRGSRRTRL